MAKKKKRTIPLPPTTGGIGQTVRQALAKLGLADDKPANKYHAQAVEVDGIRFASKKEARRWGELQLLEKQGVIRDLKRQVKYPLTLHGQLICTYIGDFVYVDVETGREHLEDAKGVRTPAYVIKRRLLLVLRGIKIEEI